MTTSELLERLRTPDLMPWRGDFGLGLLSFAEMNRDCYRESVWLDERIVRASGRTFDIGAAELPVIAMRPERTPHYIFHTAFCCSTLLAQYLERQVERCFVLKEPQLLSQLAIIAGRDILPATAWDRWLSLAICLLSRSYDAADTTILKVNDYCCGIASRLLAPDTASKAVFITMPRADFVALAMKREGWVRGRALMMKINRLGGNPVDYAAHIWQRSEDARVALMSEYGDRIKLVTAEDIADRPGATVKSCASHFGLKPPRSITAITRHVKEPERHYNATIRRREIEAMRSYVTL